MYDISTLENWVTWSWFDGYEGLDECSEEHIWSLMKEGCTEGELNRLEGNEEVRGWWKQK